MRNVIKFYVFWLLTMIFLPIGLFWIELGSNIYLTIFSFIFTFFLIYLTIKYLNRCRE